MTQIGKCTNILFSKITLYSFIPEQKWANIQTKSMMTVTKKNENNQAMPVWWICRVITLLYYAEEKLNL